MIVAQPIPVHRTGVLTRGNFLHDPDAVIPHFRARTEPIKEAGAIIASERADLVSILRGQIADPYLARKTAGVRADDVRDYVSCNKMCGLSAPGLPGWRPHVSRPKAAPGRDRRGGATDRRVGDPCHRFFARRRARQRWNPSADVQPGRDEGGNWGGVGTAWALSERGHSVTTITPDVYVGKEISRPSAAGPARSLSPKAS